MSTLVFPSSPFNGQVYPEQPIPGVKQYQYNAQADTWELTSTEGPLVDTQDPENLKLRESMMIPVLVQAIKELHAEVKALKQQLQP